MSQPQPQPQPGCCRGATRVIVIGAGAAGLTAAYDLIKATKDRNDNDNGKYQDIQVTILEASSQFGGRIRKDETFADFPIDVGGAWIHSNPDILDKIADISGLSKDIRTIWDDPRPMYEYSSKHPGKRTVDNSKPENDYMFINYTWYDFFNDHIVPSIQTKIQYNCQVMQIIHDEKTIIVKCQNGQQYQADKLIVAVPLQILQDQDITFHPQLPRSKHSALQKIPTPPGIKVFMKFSEKFYPNGFWVKGELDQDTNEKYFFNAAYGEESNEHILGVFIYGSDITKPYINRCTSEQDIIDLLLQQLDSMFGNKQATNTYINKYIVQNWQTEPFIRGAYTRYNGKYKLLRRLADPINDRIFFAGEAFPVDWENGYVHSAAMSGKVAAYQVIHGTKSNKFLRKKFKY